MHYRSEIELAVTCFISAIDVVDCTHEGMSINAHFHSIRYFECAAFRILRRSILAASDRYGSTQRLALSWHLQFALAR